MLPAFGFLALSLLGVQNGLRGVGTSLVPRVLLISSAVAMLTAGLIPLGRLTKIHGAVVILGTTLIVVAMYLLPSRAGMFRTSRLQAECWTLSAATVITSFTAVVGIPAGLALRMAASCVVGWLILLSRRLVL